MNTPASIDIRMAQPEQLSTLVAYLTPLQADPRQHVGYLDDTPAEIEMSIRENLGVEWFRATFLAYADDELAGAFLFSHDPVIGRIWLHGPYVTAGDWQETADLLYAASLAAVPLKPPYELDLFVDISNDRVDAFAVRHGFERRLPVAFLILKRDHWLRMAEDAPDTSSAVPLEPAHFDRFAQLHETLFPKAYYTSRQIEDLSGKGAHQTFICIENETVIGYIFIGLDSTEEGYIHFLGVDETMRGKGWGRVLITRAIQWLFEFPRVQYIRLSVNQDNDSAIALYVSLGFVHVRNLVGYRKKVG